MALIVGLQIVEHHLASSNAAFNEIYKVFIVDCCSPKTLEVREHKYIHELKTLKPFDINSVSPFSMPVLDSIFWDSIEVKKFFEFDFDRIIA